MELSRRKFLVLAAGLAATPLLPRGSEPVLGELPAVGAEASVEFVEAQVAVEMSGPASTFFLDGLGYWQIARHSDTYLGIDRTGHEAMMAMKVLLHDGK